MAKKLSRLKESLLETTQDMYAAGLMDQETYDQIITRHLDTDQRPMTSPLTPEAIRSLREGAHMSQAAFAQRLNLTPGYISQLERGVKRPTGSTLVLLNAIKRKGIEVVL